MFQLDLIKAYVCSYYFVSPCHMSLSPKLPVKFKKCSYHPVSFRGQGPHRVGNYKPFTAFSMAERLHGGNAHFLHLSTAAAGVSRALHPPEVSNF